MNTETTKKKAVHFTAPYLLNPVHRITVALVGAGGSGSAMLSCLASIDTALRGLGSMGLSVTVWDPDEVSPSNIGRQLFTPSEIGLNKAVALVSRFNRCFDLDWEAESRRFDMSEAHKPNIIITCTDNVASRLEIAKAIGEIPKYMCNENMLFYWLDLGNSQKSGQVILGSTNIQQPKSKRYNTASHLPFVTEEFDLTAVDERSNGPSCSLAEALSKQDLFINRTIASAAGSLLWNLLRGQNVLTSRGFYLNLETLTCVPIRITA